MFQALCGCEFDTAQEMALHNRTGPMNHILDAIEIYGPLGRPWPSLTPSQKDFVERCQLSYRQLQQLEWS